MRRAAVTSVALAGALALLFALAVVVVRTTGVGGGGDAAVPERFRRIVAVAARTCDGVDASVLAAQIDAESGWDPEAVSSVGARGIAQFMPRTWKAHGVDAPRPFSGDGRAVVWDPYDAIYSAARYNCENRRALAHVPGDPVRNVLAAYNAGPHAVARHRGVPPYAETEAYVARILETADEILGPRARGGGTPRGPDAGSAH
jgi:soluble lytic murein transglycosylase-like protein